MGIYKLPVLIAALLLPACSERAPSTPDGRISPFSPGYKLDMRAPQSPKPVTQALSPSLAGGLVSEDPLARAVQCAGAVGRLRELAQQLSEQVDPRSMEALDLAHGYYRNKARRLVGPVESASTNGRVTAEVPDVSMSSSDAARLAAACLRIDTPPGL